MAYMSQDKKKVLAVKMKEVAKKYGMKMTIGVHNHSTLVANISAGPIDFGGTEIQVNQYFIGEHYQGKAKEFLTELYAAMMVGNHDNSDVQTDYFDVGWYVDINIGKWNKPYVLVK